jgi:hypothetical protein
MNTGTITSADVMMHCERCQYLESELNRLERAHAETLGELRARAGSVLTDEHNRLRNAESETRLDVASALGELNAHKRVFHQGQTAD